MQRYPTSREKRARCGAPGLRREPEAFHGIFWVIHSDADARVSAAVIEKPLILKKDQAFRKGCSGGILTALFPRFLWLEKRFVCAGYELLGIVGREQGLPIGVRVGSNSRRSVDRGVLAVVDEHNTVIGEQRWRSNFGERAVEEPRPALK